MAGRKSSVGYKRGRKRKSSYSEKENAPPKKRIDRGKVQLDQKQWMPISAERFYTSHSDIDEKLREIESSVELVGPFRVLRGESKAEGVDLIMLDRGKRDLPETQVFMKCTAGRYAFWRDSPYEEPTVVVFIGRQTIPEVAIVGTSIEHALLHFVDLYSSFKDVKVSRADFKRILKYSEEEMLKIVKGKTKDLRHRKSVSHGGPLNAPGLILTTETELIALEDYKGDYGEEILRLGNLLGEKNQPTSVGSLLTPYFEKVDKLNQEKVYGNGLQLGHLLFLANKSWYQDKAVELLTFAYEKLNRRDFTEILKLTIELRDGL